MAAAFVWMARSIFGRGMIPPEILMVFTRGSGTAQVFLIFLPFVVITAAASVILALFAHEESSLAPFIEEIARASRLRIVEWYDVYDEVLREMIDEFGIGPFSVDGVVTLYNRSNNSWNITCSLRDAKTDEPLLDSTGEPLPVPIWAVKPHIPRRTSDIETWIPGEDDITLEQPEVREGTYPEDGPTVDAAED